MHPYSIETARKYRRLLRDQQRFERVRIGGTSFALAVAVAPRRKGMLRRWLSAIASRAAL